MFHRGDRVSWNYRHDVVSGEVVSVRPRWVLVHPDGGAFTFHKMPDELEIVIREEEINGQAEDARYQSA